MFGYYFDLALRSLKRNKVLAALMILAIGLGIGASMTMLTVLHVMTGDPFPERSGQLYRVVLDPQGEPNSAASLTYVDAMNLLREPGSMPRTALNTGKVFLHDPGKERFFAHGQYATADFFRMFGAPMRYGHGWSARDDQGRVPVVVLGAGLNRRLFGGANSVGKQIELSHHLFRVIGVLADWSPSPKAYGDVSEDAFGEPDDFFLPLSTAMQLKLTFTGHLSCWGNGGDRRTSPDCSWLQFWVRLNDSQRVHAYREHLLHYAQTHRAADRFEHPDRDVGLYDLTAWLHHVGVVPDAVKLQAWLAQGFLLVCMANIVGLLLAKFLRRSDEISVRRALGARRMDILWQLMMEAAIVGVCGGLAGLGFTVLGLWDVRHGPGSYAHVAYLDASMLLSTVALALAATVLAALIPAWRTCRVAPAIHLKIT